MTTEDPYRPPVSEAAPASEEVLYRSAGTLLAFLVPLFILSAILNLIDGGLSTLIGLQYPHLLGPNEAGGPDELFLVLGLGLSQLAGFLVYLALIVLFCVWIYRANTNAEALGAQGMEFTPGWAVGWFFVPFANLFKPYQAVREVYMAGDPELDEVMWRYGSVPWSLKLWWGTWLSANVFGNYAARLQWRSAEGDASAGVWLGIVSNALMIAAAAFAVALVISIHRRQERKFASRQRIA